MIKKNIAIFEKLSDLDFRTNSQQQQQQQQNYKL